MTQQAVFDRIRNLGVSDPKNPSAKEMKVILDAFLKNKSLGVKAFGIYSDLIDMSLKNLFDGLKAFSTDDRSVTESTMKLIDRAIAVLEKELDRDISESARTKIHDRIFALIAEARDESQQSRNFRQLAMGIVAGLVFLGIGGVVLIATKGKNKEVLEKGMNLVRGIAGKASESNST